jgi:predicted RNA-binding protein with PUA-like domain
MPARKKARPAATPAARTKKAPTKKTVAVKKAPAKSAKSAAPKAPPPSAKFFTPRTPGEVRYWLVKSEPDVFSWDQLWAAPKRTTMWDGVRNFLARNFLRDGFAIGDRIFFYHSNAEPNAIMGICEPASEPYPDPTQFDPKSEYYDPDSPRDNPTWILRDLRAVEPLPRPVTLDELKSATGLDGLELIARGSRLSVQHVSPAHWARILALAAGR